MDRRESIGEEAGRVHTCGSLEIFYGKEVLYISIRRRSPLFSSLCPRDVHVCPGFLRGGMARKCIFTVNQGL